MNPSNNDIPNSISKKWADKWANLNANNTPLPSNLSKDEIDKWNKASEIATKALQEIDDLGLSIHTAYRTSFFMQFVDKREFK